MNRFAELAARPPELRVLDAILPFHEVKRVWLFGSRARGDNHPRADVDIAVEAPCMSRARWVALKFAVDDAPVLYLVDVLRFEDLPAEFQATIRAEGRVLHERG